MASPNTLVPAYPGVNRTVCPASKSQASSGLRVPSSWTQPESTREKLSGTQEAVAGEGVGLTNLIRQLWEFRSRWMMHMECR